MQQRTTKLFRVVAVLFLLNLITVVLHACDFCGAFIGILPDDSRNSIGLMHRYFVFSGYPGMAQQGPVFPMGSWRTIPQNPSVLHGTTGATATRSPKDYESYKVVELRGKWFLFPRLEINFIVPFNENCQSYNGVKTQLDGMGDVTFYAGYHLLRKVDPDKKFRHLLVAGFGVKLPTGNCAAHNADASRISITLQTGTGSLDEIAYLAYTGGADKFRWGTTVTGKSSGTNKYNEQLSPSTSGTAFFAYLLKAGQWNFMPQAQVYGECMKGVWDHNVLLPGTGTNVMMAGPAADVFCKNFHFTSGVQFPVHEQTETYNLKSRMRIYAGISWSFSQTHFIHHTTKKS